MNKTLKPKNILTEKFLQYHYINKNKTMTQIGKEIGCSFITVMRYLRYFKIKIRNKSENVKGRINLNNRYTYKDGRTLKKYYCKCGNKISISNGIQGKGMCKVCSNKFHSKQMLGRPSPMKLKRPLCLDCKKQLKTLKSERCRSCSLKKFHRDNPNFYTGKNNPMFGKVTHPKPIIYKGIKFRSSYEVAYYKYCLKNNIKVSYETKTFDLGHTTYTPDFYLSETDEYIEIKGYWRGDALNKFLGFKLLYPEININILNEKELIKIGALK
jgi:hypothetical protein